ncbi:hypothetical protein E2C01_093410 [Portunus trituberculatus]|uniref:Uncharacterized protein n=1 Tax=Portunus trituberculatus TaxID=210409 RepID=A0A5B7JMN7_PORTR|nr:hypothetical protein [Portunus trituberculatus]
MKEGNAVHEKNGGRKEAQEKNGGRKGGREEKQREEMNTLKEWIEKRQHFRRKEDDGKGIREKWNILKSI